ncbi:MAG: serine/threonine protein kinase, partial [Leptolyngbya sp. Prado105]|nr:serine/threonine protein kinase [Leptolyngbya sp. Prado105]
LLSFGEFTWDDLKLFEREAETLRSFNHPSIPKYLDYFELKPSSGKGFALVQGYIQAPSLEQHLKAGRSFTATEVRQLAETLLEILDYLHHRQPVVIHRDIKPSNVLLSDRTGNHVGRVHLVDFGSVQSLVTKEGESITVVGTYGYMPPEQFGGRTTPASDLYSLGATLIYLVTGKHPADLPQQNLRMQFRQFATLDESLLDWLELLTEPSLEKRPNTAEAALRALREAPTRALTTVESTAPLLKVSNDQLFWNAIWRMGSIAGSLSAIIFLNTLIQGGFSPLAVSSIITIGSLLIGTTLGLSLLNGLLLAILTKRYFSPLRNVRQYRLAMTGTVAVLSAIVMAFALNPIAASTEILAITVTVMVLAVSGAGYWFAEWYVRLNRNSQRRTY